MQALAPATLYVTSTALWLNVRLSLQKPKSAEDIVLLSRHATLSDTHNSADAGMLVLLRRVALQMLTVKGFKLKMPADDSGSSHARICD